VNGFYIMFQRGRYARAALLAWLESPRATAIETGEEMTRSHMLRACCRIESGMTDHTGCRIGPA
jgi:hypothetical protein